MVFKIIHHFIGEEGVLREIKWLNKDKDTPKEQLYEWQWAPFGYDLIKLTFKSMPPTTRKFEEGSVTFDHISCNFRYYNNTFKMKRTK